MKSILNTEYENEFSRHLLFLALSLVLVTHGIILYFTLPKTYDAFVHMFFADHYARFWFEPNEYRWYTGFLTTSYPPLAHQVIALLSKLVPLKIAFCIYAIVIYEILIIGIYRFTKLFFHKNVAGVAAILGVFSTSLIETLHVYGQVPTLTGLAFLLNGLPFLYLFIKTRKAIYLFLSLSFIAVVVSSHHVTAIFGMVFFIAPTIFMSLSDRLKEQPRNFFLYLKAIVVHALKSSPALILFFGLTISLLVGLILPYWLWSKNDPITQVSIPHGSRLNFIENSSSGLVFFVIPMAIVIAFIFSTSFSLVKKRRNLGWVVSFFLCLLLGTGGTTPIPKMILGENAFNILTLDRFSFWASIIAIPFMAQFIYSYTKGFVQSFWIEKIGYTYYQLIMYLTGFSYLIFIIFIFHLGAFRPLQPKEIDIKPIVNFLNRDDHLQWRYMTLGFGDQMAWLSANSLAASVDGNYHSARRLPELTTRAVERLENAKYLGEEGLASLNDFLTNAEKYNLKYIFNNDRFYDPILYYTGWNRTLRLENGIMVWEKGNISNLKPFDLKPVSPILKKLWGVLPITTLIVAALLMFLYMRYYKSNENLEGIFSLETNFPKKIIYSSTLLPLIFCLAFIAYQISLVSFKNERKTAEKAVLNFYYRLDFQEFEEAFEFFKPDPRFSLDQYLLQKSVQDGGLLPSYAKLDSISTRTLAQSKNKKEIEVYTRWNTALAKRIDLDTLRLESINKQWFIVPPKFDFEVPELQMMSYDFTLFKKLGKRIISSFPTVKDDRVKKPFAVFKQVTCVQDKFQTFLVGEILNADNVPVNMALKAIVTYSNQEQRTYFPRTEFQYNLAPKASSAFKIPIEANSFLDSVKIENISLYVETDVSERGYVHGATTSFLVNSITENKVNIQTEIYNDLATDINLPGLLIAEKNQEGKIVNVQLHIHDRAIRSGLHSSYNVTYTKEPIQISQNIPITVFINGSLRTILPLEKDELATEQGGLIFWPHCFFAQEIYLH